MKKILLTLLFSFSFLNADITQYFPKLEGRIIDQVNLLSPAIKNDINSILKDHEKRKTNQSQRDTAQGKGKRKREIQRGYQVGRKS